MRLLIEALLKRSAYRVLHWSLSGPGCALDIETPWAGARECKIKKKEAEKDGGVAAVDCGEETFRRMHRPVGHRHHARQDEGGLTGEQADDYEKTANELQRAG